MQQTKEKTRGPAKHASHMAPRPPRFSQMSGTPDSPYMHPEQRPVDEVTEWGDWVSSEGGAFDPLFVPPQVKRPGFAYQWIAAKVLNAEDTIVKRRMMTFFRSGWKAVPGERGRGYFFLEGEDVPPVIDVGGQILVEKPEHIEKAARALNEKAAKGQLMDKMKEVGMAAPANVRAKLVSHRVDPVADFIQTVPEGSAAVPE